MILILYILSTILFAVADSYMDKGKKKISKPIESIGIVALFCVPVFYPSILVGDMIHLGLIYLFLRISLFDFVFNIANGRDLTSTGTSTPIWDDIIRVLSSWQNIALRMFFLVLSITLYFQL